ncbi:diguanylate cyclase [Streptomyces sp. NBC_01390]|uniref:GGDEF domain-containing protein n=1 Tax=Streptomyces sp. NBC_01390 TaxID=2903850 RepID=UPI003248B993
MTHDPTTPGPVPVGDARSAEARIEELLTQLDAPRPAFSDGELLAGFHAVTEQLDTRDGPDESRDDLDTRRAEIGADAYALGMEYSARKDWERATRWLQLAARSGVADASYELQTFRRRRATSNVIGPAHAPDKRWEEPASRLARLRRGFVRLHNAESLAHTLKSISDGAVQDLDYRVACFNLVRPDGDLVVVSVAGDETAEAFLTGRVGPRAAWDARLSMGERWGDVVFVSHQIGWTADGDGVPAWRAGAGGDPAPGAWHYEDRLFAEVRADTGALLGVLSVDLPRNGLLPGPWEREALALYAREAGLALAAARLRAAAERARVRSEQENGPLPVSEARVHRAMEHSPRPMALAELPPEQSSRLLYANAALCRMLDRAPAALREFSVEDLVHPDDLATWLRMSLSRDTGRIRLARRDGSYVTTSVSAVPVTTGDGRTPPGGPGTRAPLPRLLITLDLRRPDRPDGRPALARDPLTGAVTGSALRSELRRLRATTGTDGPAMSLALLSFGLDDFTQLNAAHGPETGDAVLVEVVQRLTGLTLPGDVVARVGGDEFVLLAPGRTFQQVEELEPRVLAALAHPVHVGDVAVQLSASVGRGWARDGMTAEQLLDTADQDMHFAKILRKTVRLSYTS